ncbi:protein fuzzy homolog isoform X4 [Gallus gallus]|uniref:protein fuzzy homolog isoform X4 n=1 Tax=Gallus gallus TaxID=9031 RepID=UPI001AE796B8|nr:protein fuzzy homolog isoform X4 [Gallus gallus]
MEVGGTLLLVGVASASGLPLFCRSRGAPARMQLPFPLVGALHGVHVFGAGGGVGLRGAQSGRGTLAWRGGDSVTLLALSSEPAAPEGELRALLERVHGAMVMVMGAEELSAPHGPERLKRELKRCFPLLDALIGGDVVGGAPLPRPFTAPPRPEMEAALLSLGAAARCGLCCIHGSGGRPLAATAPWRALPRSDAALLGALVTSGATTSAAARDLPVFLPHGSPTVPLRLLVLPLVGGLWLLMLCGPQPSLQCAATQLVPHFLGPAVEPLRRCARPPPAPLPPNVMAYLLIDRQHCTSHSGVGPGGSQNSPLPPRRYGAALRRMKALLVERYCPEGGGGAVAPPRLCYAALPTVTACLLLAPPRLLLLLLLPHSAPRRCLWGTAQRALQALGGS